MHGNRNISLTAHRVILRHGIPGTAITNPDMKIFSQSALIPGSEPLTQRTRRNPAHPAQSSAGLSIPVTRRITTGPVAGWRRDGSSTVMYDSDGDLLAPVSTLGWRVDSFVGPVRPWAQVSYNQPFGENVWQSQAGLHLVPTSSQYETWVDVSVGVDMPLTRHVAAWTSLSQSDGTTDSGDLFIYNLGLSAKF